MKKKDKKVAVELPQAPVTVKRTFFDNFPIEERRAYKTWLVTIAFFFLMLYGVDYDFSKAKGVEIALFLVNICVGGIAFLYLFINTTARLFKKNSFFHSTLTLGLMGIIIIGFFTLLIKFPGINQSIANNENPVSSPISNSQTNLPNNLATPSATIFPKPTPKPVATIKPVVDDGKITCNISSNCGGGTIRLTSSECSQSTCCQVGSTWSFYRDKNKCTEDQKAKYPTASYTPYTYAQPSYPPCEIYYSALGYSQTYTYMSVEKCNEAKRNVANTGSTTITVPTPTPQPTIDYEYCNGVVAEWASYKEYFYANSYNNFSSSAEAMVSLNSSMQLFQNKLNNAHCGDTLRLY